MRKRLIVLLILTTPLLMATSAGLHWKSFTFSSDGTNTTVTTAMLFPNGTALLPSVAGTNFTTTGLFWAAGPVLGFTVSGGEVGRFTTATLLLPAGSVSAPPLSFSVATKGFYHNGSGTLGFTSNGNNNINFGAGTIEVEGDGTIGFSSVATDATAAFDTAISRVGAAVFGFGSNSGANVKWSLDASTTTMKVRNAANNADAPMTASTGTFSVLTANTAIVSGAGGLIQSVVAVTNGVLINGSPPTFSATPQVSAIGINTIAGVAGTLTIASGGSIVGVGNVLYVRTAPTISSGFGTSPSIDSHNGSGTFRVNVGGGGVATSGVVGMPTATTGWNCFVEDQTTANVNTRQTASTNNSVTFGTTVAWAANDILLAVCMAY